MKRKIIVLFVLLSLLLTIAAGAFAASWEEVSISEDLEQVTIGGHIYVRANLSDLHGYYRYMDSVTISLTEAQKQEYEQVKLYVMADHDFVIQLSLRRSDGVFMEISYIRQDMYEAYMALPEQEEYTIKFLFPDENEVVTKKTLLCGEETTLYRDQLRKMKNYFNVWVVGQEDMRIEKGWLLCMEDEYYYVDKAHSGLDSEVYIRQEPKIAAYKITDPELCARLDDAMDRYYEGLGIFEDSEATDKVAGVFLVILFCLLPVAALITFAILAIVSKKKTYRTLCIIVCGFALMVLLTILVIVLIV